MKSPILQHTTDSANNKAVIENIDFQLWI